MVKLDETMFGDFGDDDTQLRGEESKGNAIGSPTGPLHAFGLRKRSVEFFPPGIPKRIGRYKLLRFIGSGGFGMVFEATDTLLFRNVAIKLPKTEITTNPEAVKAFLDEGRAISKLDHPGIAVPLDAGIVDSQPFLVYPLCPGPNLQKWFIERNFQVPAELAARVVLEISEIVTYSHNANVLHRDIKPANFLLFPSTSKSSDFPFQIRLTDFGLAKVAEIGFGVATSSMIVGTPLYLAPEVLSPSRPASEASDVYSIGVVLYHLLTGCNPFESDDLLELIRKIREKSPKLPSSIRNGIPPSLDAICLKCLEKDPRDRYAKAHDLSLDLQRFLAGKPVGAIPVLRFRRIRHWLSHRDRRREVGAVSILFAVFILLWSVLGLVALHLSGDYTASLTYAASNIAPLALAVALPLVIAGRGVTLGSRNYAWAGVVAATIGILVSLLSFTPYSVAFPEIYALSSIANTIVFTMLGIAFLGILITYAVVLAFWRDESF